MFELKLRFRKSQGPEVSFEELMRKHGKSPTRADDVPTFEPYRQADEQLGCYAFGMGQWMFVSRYTGDQAALYVHWVYEDEDDGTNIRRLNAFASQFEQDINTLKKCMRSSPTIELATLTWRGCQMPLGLERNNALLSMFTSDTVMKIIAGAIWLAVVIWWFSPAPPADTENSSTAWRESDIVAAFLELARAAVAVAILAAMNFVRFLCKPRWRVYIDP